MLPEDLYLVLIWSIIIGIVAAVVAVVIVVVKYKKKLKAPIYPIDKYASLSLVGSHDNFLRRNVTRVRVTSNNNKKR